MGYHSHVLGHIEIIPTIDPEEFAKYDLPGGILGNVRFATSNDEPFSKHLPVSLIVGAWDDAYSAYNLDRDLAEALRIVEKCGSRATGELIRVGEDNGDVERYLAFSNQPGLIRCEKARLVWPNGDLVDIPW